MMFNAAFKYKCREVKISTQTTRHLPSTAVVCLCVMCACVWCMSVYVYRVFSAIDCVRSLCLWRR